MAASPAGAAIAWGVISQGLGPRLQAGGAAPPRRASLPGLRRWVSGLIGLPLTLAVILPGAALQALRLTAAGSTSHGVALDAAAGHWQVADRRAARAAAH